jgi:hypothetical protein
VVAVVVCLPTSASAFPCGEAPRPSVPPRQLANLQATDDCRSPGELQKHPAKRARKKGSISGLTVFVLVIGGALLIPIGRNGLPRNVDPYGHDRSLSEG